MIQNCSRYGVIEFNPCSQYNLCGQIRCNSYFWIHHLESGQLQWRNMICSNGLLSSMVWYPISVLSNRVMNFFAAVSRTEWHSIFRVCTLRIFCGHSIANYALLSISLSEVVSISMYRFPISIHTNHHALCSKHGFITVISVDVVCGALQDFNLFHCLLVDQSSVAFSGEICINILKDSWSPALNMEKTLLSLIVLLRYVNPLHLLSEYINSEIHPFCCLYIIYRHPNPSDPLVADIAHLFINDKQAHDHQATDWTKRYAMYDNRNTTNSTKC